VKCLEQSLAQPESAYPQLPPKGQSLPWKLVLVALALAAALAGSQASGQPEKTESIRGIVINSVTRLPIARALVSSSDQRFAVLTDQEGRFEFTLPRTSADENGQNVIVNSSVFLLARKPGFLNETPSRSVASYAPGNDITLTLIPEALIIGKVTLPNSEAPDGIFLQVYRRQIQDGFAHWVPAGGTQSRSDGEFRFADLPAGTYKLLTREQMDRDPLSFDPQGQLYGYPPVYAPNAPDFNSAGTIEVAAGTTNLVNLSVSRKPYHRVHIPVANPPADAGLNINVSVAGHKGPGFSLGYDNRSQAIEGMLPDGTYMVEAFAFGTGQGSGTGSLSITVSGAAVRGPTMTLVPNPSIRLDVNEQFASTDNSGSITFSTGRRRSTTLKGPRRYLNVTLEPADDFERGGVNSLRDPTGPGDDALVIENARPGRYWVRVHSTRGYAASVRSGNVDLLTEPLVVGTGGSPAPIEITMRDDTAELDGVVEGIAPSATPAITTPDVTTGFTSFVPFGATPASPAHIYCVPVPDGGGQVADIWVAPDGTFTSPPLAPGAYRVLAFDRPQSQLEYRNPEAMQAYESKGPVVRIAGGQKENVRLQLITSD
jgi:hypothetical protein